MLKQKTKIIEVAGKSYQLTKMDARTGSYIALKAAGILAPSANGNTAALAGALTSMPRKDFDELQTLLLKTVKHMVEAPNGQQVPEPVLTAKGDFVDESLAYDVASVIRITVEALMFNVGGFFGEAGLTLPEK